MISAVDGRRHEPRIGAARAALPRWLLEHGELNMHALGPGSELEAEWAVAGLRLPDRSAVRCYRLERVRSQLRVAGCDAALLYDPLNVRYTTDTTNMSIWTMHNAVLEPGMAMCIEAFVGAKSGGEGVKLEQQVLITETGNELLTKYPLDLI